MQENPILGRDLVKEPSLWRLAMLLADDALHLILYCAIEENSLIYREIPADKAASSPLKAFEDAVYDNPVLLNEFSRVDVAVSTDKFSLVPAQVADRESREKIFHALAGNFDGEILCDDLKGTEAALLTGITTDLAGFLRRTFPGVRIRHRLASLCEYFCEDPRGGNRMYANFGKGTVDLLLFSGDALKLANTYVMRDPMDAVYYILACRALPGFAGALDGLFLAGDQGMREKLTPTLREHFPYVMPVEFPQQMFRAGKDSLLAPFSLVALSLCE